MWATVIGSHLKKEPTVSPVLTKWWKLELTLATNFGSHAQMVTKFSGQILATKFGFVPDWWVKSTHFIYTFSTLLNTVMTVTMFIQYIPAMHFYPRPVLAFGYCRCLRVCVCLSVNHQLVRTITHQPFKLESPNLDQRCKRPWLRSLLFWGAIDLDLQGQI